MMWDNPDNMLGYAWTSTVFPSATISDILLTQASLYSCGMLGVLLEDECKQLLVSRLYPRKVKTQRGQVLTVHNRLIQRHACSHEEQFETIGCSWETGHMYTANMYVESNEVAAI